MSWKIVHELISIDGGSASTPTPLAASGPPFLCVPPDVLHSSLAQLADQLGSALGGLGGVDQLDPPSDDSPSPTKRCWYARGERAAAQTEVSDVLVLVRQLIGQALAGNPDVTSLRNDDRCWQCRVKDRPACLVKSGGKCATCGQECSLRPSTDSSRQRARLIGVYATLDATLPILESEGAEPATRACAAANVKKAMDDLARVGVRWGGIEFNGEHIEKGL